MQTIRRLFHRATWLALVAMLGLALAPTLSHAFAAASPGAPWSEICSAAGHKYVVVGADDAAQADGAGLGHCPLCAQIGHAPALPVIESVGAPLVDGADHLPTLFAQSPTPLFAWAAAQPRAPPSSC